VFSQLAELFVLHPRKNFVIQAGGGVGGGKNFTDIWHYQVFYFIQMMDN
jgi:hypothetical protein